MKAYWKLFVYLFLVSFSNYEHTYEHSTLLNANRFLLVIQNGPLSDWSDVFGVFFGKLVSA